MKLVSRCLLLSVAVVAAALLSSSVLKRLTAVSAASRPVEDNSTHQELKAFAAIQPIDVHVHIFKTDPAFQGLLEHLNLKVLDILVMDDTTPYRRQLSSQVTDALALVRASHGHVALCTTFDPYQFENPHFTSDAIRQLNDNFAQGALAVKIWKNIGMEIKHEGKFVMADDPKFQLIYQDIAKHGKTLMSHQAEPDVAWGPPDPADPSWSYYQENPQWLLYNKPGIPSKQQILEARDDVLASNPKLRMVGVHLGSMEKNLDSITAHFKRYPNFAVDTAGRMEYLMLAPRDKARAFMVENQDRVLYGTDLDLLADANVQETLNEWQSTYARDWKFLATDQMVEYNGKHIRGLLLPHSVLRTIFRTNAQHWIPGL